MKTQKEKGSLLIDKMKNTHYILVLFLVFSCTSNTIFEKPKDIIPKDTMSLLIEDMMIASSARLIKNKNKQININYMPFVYEIYKIDSTRFQNSNYYYMTNIDVYEEIFTNAKAALEKRKKELTELKIKLDSIEKDSLNTLKVKKKERFVEESTFILDTLKKKQLKKSLLFKKEW